MILACPPVKPVVNVSHRLELGTYPKSIRNLICQLQQQSNLSPQCIIEFVD